MRSMLVFAMMMAAGSYLRAEGIEVGKPGEKAKSDFSCAWEVQKDCDTPESAYFDPGSGSIYVSNIIGDGMAKDGKGTIQKINLDGTLAASPWVKDLNAPKGMRAHQGVLWVTDIDEVVAIDIKTGELAGKKIKIEGAKFLNDIAIAEDGRVFVSDTPASKIYVIEERKPAVFLSGDELQGPNGLLVTGKKLLVAAWGLAGEDWSTKIPGGLYAIDLDTRKITPITQEPLGNLDGLEIAASGDYLVSDWSQGKVFRVKPDGGSRVLFSGFKGAADIGYVPEKDLLVVPRMQENAVWAGVLPRP